jgi:hypothetical protein
LDCYKPDTFAPVLQTSIIGLNSRHQKRRKFLEECNVNGKKVNIISIWECEWDNMCKNDVNVKKFLEKNEIVSPLNPSDALSG